MEARDVPLLPRETAAAAPGAGGAEADEPRWERKTVDEATRRWLNGESRQQMAFAEAMKRDGGVAPNGRVTYGEGVGTDTSRDQPWPLDTSPFAIWSDRYVLCTTVLWLGIKITVFAPFMLLFHVPPMALARCYISSIPDDTRRLKRSKCFYACYLLAAFCSIPAGVLVVLSFLLDCIMYYVFGFLFCATTCSWKQMMESHTKVAPYRNGPSIIRRMPDFFAAVMGQCARQSPCETLYMVSCMWLLIPWLKYYICCNPWIYELDYRMVQQISTQMQDLGSSSEAADTARYIISYARQARRTAHRLDIWSFVPHYPLPPKNRRWALGLQAGGAKFPGKFTCIVHTTHAVSEAGGSTEQFVLSNCVQEPVYRVMLWYSNPFHFLTGWVEASISTGEPSQPNKRLGGEHPMWLVTGRTPMVAGRTSFTGSGMIDAFFDYWLPIFVHEMRYLTFEKKLQDEGRTLEDARKTARDYADLHYQEVHSQDGISRPLTFVGRINYEAKDALTEHQQQHGIQALGRADDEAEQSGASYWIASVLSGLANTNVGQTLKGLQQGSDMSKPGGLLDAVEHMEGRFVDGAEGLLEAGASALQPGATRSASASSAPVKRSPMHGAEDIPNGSASAPQVGVTSIARASSAPAEHSTT